MNSNLCSDSMNSISSYENEREYNRFYDCGYDFSPTSQYNIDGMSESSEECFSIYEQSLTDSYFNEYEDELSSNFSFYETDSAFDDFRSDNGTATSSTSEASAKSNSRGVGKAYPNGILKKKERSIENASHQPLQDHNNNITAPITQATIASYQPLQDHNNNITAPITQATIEKIRESELEDILQYARDIVNPDPSAKLTYSSQPAKVVQGSFRHLLSVKELHSKTGAFKYRTIEITRIGDEDLGFSIRQGDGWEKKDGIYISRVSLGSVFDQYEILTIGDEVIQVNKVDVKKMNVDDIVRLMHIPERLSVTIKMLTPFSKKRVEKSGINKFKLEQKKFIAAPSNDDIYKVAHMKIGGNGKRNVDQPRRTILVRNKNNAAKEQKTARPSAYRTMEGGRTVPSLKNNLSPIREVSSETQLNNPLKQRHRQSYVTWYDQRSVTSGPI